MRWKQTEKKELQTKAHQSKPPSTCEKSDRKAIQSKKY